VRAWIWVVLASCTAAAAPHVSVVANHADRECSPAEWRAAVMRNRHARVAEDDALLAVVAEQGDDIVLASDLGSAIVVRRFARAALRPAVVFEVRVEPYTDDYLVDDKSGVWLEPGYPMPRSDHDPIRLDVIGPIAFGGWVYAASVGKIWEEAPTRRRHDATLEQPGDLYYEVAPSPESLHVARLARDVEVTADNHTERGSTLVEALHDRVRAYGWLPGLVLARTPRTYDFSEPPIEREAYPVPAVRNDTCIRAAPSDEADAIGIVTGPLSGTSPDIAGWLRIPLRAPWGATTGYVRIR
jgi:hypothetical protein